MITAQDYPNVALMVITDGRWDYLWQTLRSFTEQCDFPFSDRWIVNDSGEPFPHDQWPADLTDGWLLPPEPPTRGGLANAIQRGWDNVTWGDNNTTEYVFHLEDDFIFPGPVPIREMLDALRTFPQLAQVALKRQPWSPQEQLAGNILNLKADLVEVDGLCIQTDLFTFNPCLYPREITRYGADLERELSDKLLADGWKFGFYGAKDDPPRCIHIGHRRSEGYRW